MINLSGLFKSVIAFSFLDGLGLELLLNLIVEIFKVLFEVRILLSYLFEILHPLLSKLQLVLDPRSDSQNLLNKLFLPLLFLIHLYLRR
jgi:hypothetical protein